MAILSDGKINVRLSPQQLLSCNQHKQRGCDGGYLDRAWWYIRKLGQIFFDEFLKLKIFRVVADECYPYISGKTQNPGECQMPKAMLREENPICVDPEAANHQIYKMTPPYRVSSREHDIQTEILMNGPVQATFLVHEDFFMYKNGVYQHTNLAEKKGQKYLGNGYHSVRIIG